MGGKLTDILIIHKDLSLVAFAVDILEKYGYRIQTASAMRDALLILHRKPIGLIMCGLELADVSGELLLSYLKNDPLREKIPFIFFLSVENQNKLSPRRSIQMGAEDLFYFPIDEQTLISRIHEIFPQQTVSSPSVIDDGVLGKPAPSSKPSGLAPPSTDPEVERRTEGRMLLNEPITVEVSNDGDDWGTGTVQNNSCSGAMIKTDIPLRYASKVMIRKTGDENGPVAIGYVAHILKGDNNQRVGVGLNFYDDDEWIGFFTNLAACVPVPEEASVPEKEPDISDIFPLKAELSRDGFFWLDCEFTSGDESSGQIETLMIVKTDETVKLRFKKAGIKERVEGTVTKVGFGKNQTNARLDLKFEENSNWSKIVSHFMSAAVSDSSRGNLSDSVVKTPQTLGDVSDSTRQEIQDKWSKAVLNQEVTSDKPKSATEKKSAKNRQSQNQRFFQSLIGRKVDNFEVVSFISSGGMGGVLRGWDTALERDVALKVISWELATQKVFVDMFFKEARFISKLNHPNISQIYHIGNSNDIIYYAMEFVHGKNLLELNKQKVRFPAEQVVKFLRTVCNAMNYVWKNKIIHRDIKPSNIMLTKDNSLKIVDFGVAKLYNKDRKKSESKITGTPLYISPEAIRDEDVDHRSDIYSIGATFYHIFSGSPPFIDISLKKIIQKHLNEPLPSLKQKAPDVPDEVCAIIEKMMEKNIDKRFQNYKEIIESLDDFIINRQTSSGQED